MAWQHENTAQPLKFKLEQHERLVISPAVAKAFNLKYASVGYSWDFTPYVETDASMVCTGNCAKAHFVVQSFTHKEETLWMHMQPQTTNIEGGGKGITPIATDGEHTANASARVWRIGDYHDYFLIGNHQLLDIPFKLRPIFVGFPCDVGNGIAHHYSIEIYTSFFDLPPRTNDVRVFVGGHEFTAEMQLFGKGQGRIDLSVTEDEYREAFNPSFEPADEECGPSEEWNWNSVNVRVETDSKIPVVVRSLAFPSSMPHC